ncbi:MAG: hypothetical protein DPW18_19790, partial [Chloroflexi bacterium]|nr:hypothetical protein [Chloroflexota bacterium]MDL1945023.1 hypothetical protein [Chloroflexi bacterium CFX2]
MNKRVIRILILTGIALGLMVPVPSQRVHAAGTDRYVAPGGSNMGDCTNPGAPCATIAYAIAQSSSAPGVADKIHIAAGTYNENLGIGKSVELYGAGINQTFIDGMGSNRVITIGYGSAVTIADLTVQNGSTSSSGGGISNSGSLVLMRAKVTGNHSTGSGGGGIYNDGGMTLTDVVISNNTAYVTGGGIWNSTSSAVTLSRVTISGNTVTDSSGFGGGLHAQGTGGLTLINVTISDNTANSGGGFSNTISTTVEWINSTIANNHVPGVLGAGGFLIYGGSVTITNTIIAYNDNNECYIDPSASVISGGYNIDNDATCLTPSIAQSTDMPSTDPMLNPLGNNGGYVNVHTLKPGSPAIDAGSSSACIVIDASRWSRPQDGNGDSVPDCDTGASEAPATALFRSQGTYDGWILESSEASGAGGTMNPSAATFNLGDDAANRQYRTILHFDTSALPDNAVITSAVLKIRKQ